MATSIFSSKGPIDLVKNLASSAEGFGWLAQHSGAELEKKGGIWGMLGAVGKTLGGAFNWIGSALGGLAGVLSSALGPIGAIITLFQILAEVLKMVGIDLGQLISGAFAAFINWLMSLKGVQSTVSALSNAFRGLVDFLMRLAGALARAIGPIIDVLGELLGAVINMLMPAFSNLGNIIIWLVNMIGNAINTAMMLIKPIVDFVVWIINIITGVLNVIASMFGWLLGVLGGGGGGSPAEAGGGDVYHIQINANIASPSDAQFVAENVVTEIRRQKYLY